MTKKILNILIILFILLSFANISFATDILMNLNDTNSIQTNSQVDDTIYGAETILDNEDTSEQVSSTIDYDDSAELSITNMINIVLIAVGVVLILLGIAIIIKLK